MSPKSDCNFPGPRRIVTRAKQMPSPRPAEREAFAQTAADARPVVAKALRWLNSQLHHFNPFVCPDGASQARQTALAELALLGFELQQQENLNAELRIFLHRIQQVLQAAYQRPELHRFIYTGPPQAFTGHLLMWLALPRQLAETILPLAELQKVFETRSVAHAPRPKVRLLELRYFADYAGLAHELPTPRELFESLRDLGQCDPKHLNVPAIYDLTHLVFYLTHFGRRPDAVLQLEEREHLAKTLQALQRPLIQVEHWDLVAELALSQRCLGLPEEMLMTDSAWRALAAAQDPDGTYGAQFLEQLLIEQGMTPEAAAQWAFLRCYHPCLVTVMAGLCPQPLL